MHIAEEVFHNSDIDWNWAVRQNIGRLQSRMGSVRLKTESEELRSKTEDSDSDSDDASRASSEGIDNDDMHYDPRWTPNELWNNAKSHWTASQWDKWIEEDVVSGFYHPQIKWRDIFDYIFQ